MARGKAHPAEIQRAAAAACIAGESLSVVAKRYGVNKSTIIRWRDLYAPVQTENARTREEMTALIYDTIGDHFRALRVQLSVVSDPDWVKSQSAADIAGLMAVIGNRAHYLLAGIRPIDAGDESTTAEPPGLHP